MADVDKKDSSYGGISKNLKIYERDFSYVDSRFQDYDQMFSISPKCEM